MRLVVVLYMLRQKCSSFILGNCKGKLKLQNQYPSLFKPDRSEHVAVTLGYREVKRIAGLKMPRTTDVVLLIICKVFIISKLNYQVF